MATRNDRFNQLTGAFDDPIAPSPAFAARLRAQVLAELAESSHANGASPNSRRETIMVAPVAATPDRPARRLRQGTRKGTLLRPRWTRTTALINVAAILLLLVAVARFFAPEHTAPDSTYRLPAIASQPSGSQTTPLPSLSGPASMWGANPAQTWNMATTAPDTSGWRPTVALQGTGHPISAAIIHKGVLYLSTPGSTNGEEPQIKAVDIVSGKTLWSAQLETYGRMAATDVSLFVLHAISNPGNQGYSARLAALDTGTGKVRWELSGETIAPLRDTQDVGPVIDDDRIYLGTPDGHVLIVDPQTGALQATLGPKGPVEFAARDAATGDAVPILPGGSVAADQNSIYTILYDGTLAAYDANRMNLDLFAQQWASGIVPSNGDAKVINAQVMVSEGTVIVLATSGVPTGDMSSPFRSIAQTVTAYDAPHGIRLWSHELSGSSNHMTIAAGNVVVSLGGTGDTPARVSAYHLRDGADRWNVGGLGNDPVWLSAAGDAVYVLNPQGMVKQIRAAAMNGGTAVNVQDLSALPSTPTRGPFYSPLTLEHGALYAIEIDGTVIRLGPTGAASTPAATPAASPPATPQVSQSSSQPGADGGQTNQYAVSVGEPRRLDLLGTEHQPFEVAPGPIVSSGTLYRVQMPTQQPSTTNATVGAVSLADGASRTVYADPAHGAQAIMMRGDQLLVVANPVIGQATAATLSAIDPAAGHALWSLDLFAGPVVESQPLLSGDMVFVADQSGTVHGISLATHRVVWTTPMPSLGAPPDVLAADGTLLYVANGFNLSAIDQATGARRWQVDLSSQVLGITSIGVASGMIVVSGSLATGPLNTPATPPRTGGEVTYNASRVLAISSADHTIRWHWDTADKLSRELVVTAGRVVIGHGAGGPFGDTTALDLATGKVAWQLTGALPVLADRDQVVAVTLEIHALPGTRPATPVPGARQPVLQRPPAAETSATLLGIDPATGTTRWVQGESLGTASPIAYLPIAHGVVIPLANGQVVVLRD